MTRPPPSSPLFPYTTLFRSHNLTLVRALRQYRSRWHSRRLSVALTQVIQNRHRHAREHGGGHFPRHQGDRKSTRLNSSHMSISYAVFCLKKKKKTIIKHDLR